MANSASAKDIQDLTKSIQTLVSTFGASTSKKTASLKRSQPEPESDDIIGQLEVRRAAQKEEEAFQQRMADYWKAGNDATKQLAANQKAWGTEQYKTLDLTEQISELTYDINDLNEKYVAAKKDGNKELQKEVGLTLKNARERRKGLEALQEQSKSQDKLNKLAEKQVATYKKITDAIKDPIHALEGFADSLSEKMGKRFNASLAAPKKSLMEMAGSAASFATFFGLAVVIKQAFHVNEELVQFQRNLGISRKEAQGMSTDINRMAQNSEILNATQEDYANAVGALTSQFGTAVSKNTKLVDSQVLLTKQFAMTNEEALEFQNLSAGTGKSVEYNLGIIDAQVEKYNILHGASVDVREIQKEVGKVSGKTLASYKGNVKALAAAVIQAKKLGMTMEDTAGVSKNLLDFETSIENEMKANVLTGRSMNMNKARMLALQGKSDEAAAEALKQAGSYEKFMDMNILQQEAVAAAAGMTVDQVVKAGQEEKKRAIMGEKNFRDLSKDEKKRLVDLELLTEEQIKQNIQNEQAATIKEKMVVAGDKLIRVLEPIAEKFIEPLLNGLSKAITFIGNIKKKLSEMLPPEAKTLIKGTAAVLAGGVLIKKAFQGIKGFFGKKPEERQVELLQSIDNSLKGNKGATENATDNKKGFIGRNVDRIKSVGAGFSNIGKKFKSFKEAKKTGGWGAAIKSLFTKENAADAVSAVTESAPGAPGGTGTAPIGTEADPIYVKVIGGMSGGTATEEAADAGGNPLVDAGLNMFKDSKLGKKFSKMTGGLSDTLLDSVGDGGMGGDSTEAATNAAPLKKDGTPDKRFKANKTPKAPSPTPSSPTPPSSKGGGGFFGGLIDKFKNSKLVSKVGDFAKKLNPLSALKKVFTNKGTISKLLGKIPKIGSLVSMATTLYSLGSDAASSGGSFQDVGKQLVMTLGDLGGSIIGGLLGSLGGPAAIAGSILGGMAGSSLAGIIADNVDLSGLGKIVVDILGPGGEGKEVAVKDALIRPGQPPITFDKGDMILAGTNLLGESTPSGNGGTGNSELAGLLKELIAKVDQPVQIKFGTRVIDEIDKQATLRRGYANKIDNTYGRI